MSISAQSSVRSKNQGIDGHIALADLSFDSPLPESECGKESQENTQIGQHHHLADEGFTDVISGGHESDTTNEAHLSNSVTASVI